MNTNVDNIEEEINNEFKKQVSELPEELKDPVENTLEYIKKRAKCNDYEAAQINILMSEQSGQKTGYKYYCRYIAGQSTPEEDNADYYKSIRKSWNKFLDKYANMSTEERVEALTVVSASFDNVAEVLVNADPQQLDYILKKTEKEKNKIEELSEELQSHKTSYLVMHPEYTMKKTEELAYTVEKYNKKIIRSAKEHELTNPDDVYIDKLNAYDNIIKSLDALHVKNKNLQIWGGVWHNFTGNTKQELKKYIYDRINAEIDSEGKATGSGDIIQVELASEHKNLPMYLYAQVYDKIKEDLSFNCRVMTLRPFDEKGNEIKEGDSRLTDEIGAETKEKDMPPEIDRLNRTGYNPDTEKGKITKTLITTDQLTEGISDEELADPKKKNEALAKIKTKYTIQSTDKDHKTRFSDLYTVYQLDPTYFEHRISSLGMKIDEPSRQLSIALTTIGSVLVLVGIVVVVIGAIYLCCKYCCGGGSEFTKMSDDKNVSTGGSQSDTLTLISLFGSGVAAFVTGATTLVPSAMAVDKANNWKKERGKTLQNIYKDIWVHNKFPKDHKN